MRVVFYVKIVICALMLALAAAILIFAAHSTHVRAVETVAPSAAAAKAASVPAKNNADTSPAKPASEQPLSLKAEGAVAVDVDTGSVLAEKNMHEHLYPASLTKLMTALLLSENRGKNDLLTYSAYDRSEPSNKMDYAPNTQITADNAMKGMLIFSANDIAAMVAENLGGSIPGFAVQMNQKAAVLGMKDTHFVNPNGLHDSNHYSSPYDISLLARQAYKNDWILHTLEMPSAQVLTTDGKAVTVYNTNDTLGQNDCFAGKTGHTSEAGYCLAAFYHYGKRTLLCVVMKSPDGNTLYADMSALIANAEKR